MAQKRSGSQIRRIERHSLPQGAKRLGKLVHLEKACAKVLLHVSDPRIQLDRRFELPASSFILALLHIEGAEVIVDDIGARVGARKRDKLSLGATQVAPAQHFFCPLQTLLDVLLTEKSSRSFRNWAESQEERPARTPCRQVLATYWKDDRVDNVFPWASPVCLANWRWPQSTGLNIGRTPTPC